MEQGKCEGGIAPGTQLDILVKQGEGENGGVEELMSEQLPEGNQQKRPKRKAMCRSARYGHFPEQEERQECTDGNAENEPAGRKHQVFCLHNSIGNADHNSRNQDE